MTHDDFLREILASPDDDAPRLIYADWLEERGDPRGEFIRVQCELARLDTDGRTDEGRLRALRVRESELLQFKFLWGESIWRKVNDFEFRRGFIEKVIVNVEDFLRHAEALFAGAPIIDIEFRGWLGPEISGFARVQQLLRLRRLDLSETQLQDAGTRIIVASPYMRNVSDFRLAYNGITADGVRALVTLSWLPSLQHLDLQDNPIADYGIRLLAEWPGSARLLTLNLRSTGMHDEGALALARSPLLTDVGLLKLSPMFLTDQWSRTLRARFGTRLQMDG
jgi:uncharacterized protein (TIGR02996 family)